MRLRRRLTQLLSRRALRYIFVGAFNTIFGLAVFAGLIFLAGDALHYLVILLIAHVIAVLTAFLLHRRVVFQVTGHFWRDLWRFWSVYLSGLALNLVLLPVGVEVIHLPALVAQVVIIAVTAIATYVAHSRFSFVRKRPLGESATNGSDMPTIAGSTDWPRSS